ncbi:hypothetical protein LINGRAPRIM_LOCUS2532 [Linum grandiflorum]
MEVMMQLLQLPYLIDGSSFRIQTDMIHELLMSTGELDSELIFRYMLHLRNQSCISTCIQ